MLPSEVDNASPQVKRSKVSNVLKVIDFKSSQDSHGIEMFNVYSLQSQYTLYKQMRLPDPKFGRAVSTVVTRCTCGIDVCMLAHIDV